MPRFLLFLGSSLLGAGLAQAQVGVRAGANLLGVRTQTAADGTRATASRRAGYQVGVFYRQPLTPRLSLVPEVQFSREQARVALERYSVVQLRQGSATLQTTAGDYELALSYLNVPVLLRCALGPVYFEAGPQASLLVGGQGKGAVTYLIGGDALASRDINQAATDRYRRFDAGACLGLGVALPAGLGLSVRAYQGFAALDQGAGSQEFPIPYLGTKTRRQTLQASVTYQLFQKD